MSSHNENDSNAAEQVEAQEEQMEDEDTEDTFQKEGSPDPFPVKNDNIADVETMKNAVFFLYEDRNRRLSQFWTLVSKYCLLTVCLYV